MPAPQKLRPKKRCGVELQIETEFNTLHGECIPRRECSKKEEKGQDNEICLAKPHDSLTEPLAVKLAPTVTYS
jgi:hypothetical protein